MRSPMLDVDRVQVLGGQTTGMDALQRALGIGIGDQMVDLDLGAAERRLEQLPWVRTARVVRSWPATLRVIVVERQPEARIADPDGRWWLADGTGRLLDVVSDPPPDLLQVDGYVDRRPARARSSRSGPPPAWRWRRGSPSTWPGAPPASASPTPTASTSWSTREARPGRGSVPTRRRAARTCPRPRGGPPGIDERGRREAAGRLDRARPGRPHLPGRDRRPRAGQAGRHPSQRLRLSSSRSAGAVALSLNRRVTPHVEGRC